MLTNEANWGENVLKTQQVKIIDVTEESEVYWGLDKVRNEATSDGRWIWIFDLGLRGLRVVLLPSRGAGPGGGRH